MPLALSLAGSTQQSIASGVPNVMRPIMVAGALPVRPERVIGEMITVDECDQRIRDERRAWVASGQGGGASVPSSKGQENYQNHLDKMEAHYKKQEHLMTDVEGHDLDRPDDLYGDWGVGSSVKPSPGLSSGFQEYNAAKKRATQQGLDEFVWKGVSYVKSTWSSGVKVWKRKDGPRKSNTASVCNRHAEESACVADPSPCRFSKETEKRRSYCAKKGSPGSKMNVPPRPSNWAVVSPQGHQPPVKKKVSKNSKKKKSVGALVNSYKLFPQKYPKSKSKSKSPAGGGLRLP